MYINLETFQKYSNIFTDNTELQQSYINAAENIVENYLGYSLTRKNYVSILNGSNSKYLQLRVKPINELISVNINEQEIDITEFNIEEEFILRNNDIFPEGINISVEYNAGYNTEDIPEIICLTILRIAALLQSESDSNIGITSKSFGDNGARTFINYTNFDKYLSPISSYKLIII